MKKIITITTLASIIFVLNCKTDVIDWNDPTPSRIYPLVEENLSTRLAVDEEPSAQLFNALIGINFDFVTLGNQIKSTTDTTKLLRLIAYQRVVLKYQTTGLIHYQTEYEPYYYSTKTPINVPSTKQKLDVQFQYSFTNVTNYNPVVTSTCKMDYLAPSIYYEPIMRAYYIAVQDQPIFTAVDNSDFGTRFDTNTNAVAPVFYWTYNASSNQVGIGAQDTNITTASNSLQGIEAMKIFVVKTNNEIWYESPDRKSVV